MFAKHVDSIRNNKKVPPQEENEYYLALKKNKD